VDQIYLDDMLRTLRAIADVNMQHKDDARKLRELAECRLEAKRVLSGLPKATQTKG
jgi:hypothetical protein